MRIDDIKRIQVQIIEQGQEIYQGRSDEAPDEYKQKEIKEIQFNSCDLVIKV